MNIMDIFYQTSTFAAINVFDVSSPPIISFPQIHHLQRRKSSSCLSLLSSFKCFVLIITYLLLTVTVNVRKADASSTESQVVIQDSSDSSFINHTLTSDLIRDGRCKKSIVTLFLNLKEITGITTNHSTHYKTQLKGKREMTVFR